MLPRYTPPITPDQIISTLQAPLDEQAVIHATIAFAAVLNVDPNNIVLVDQGRSALALALKCADLVPGDEVLVPSFICSVVADTLLEYGVRPVLLDISETDLGYDQKDLEQNLSPRTKAILFVNYFGIPNPSIPMLRTFADAHKLILLEDCAHALGCTWNGQMVGTFGDLSFFSFNTDKPITAGQGGALVINAPHLRPHANACAQKTVPTPIADERNILMALTIQLLRMDSSVYTGYVSMEFGKKVIATDAATRTALEQYIARPGSSPLQLFILQDKLVKKYSGPLYKLKNKLSLSRFTKEHKIKKTVTGMNALRAMLLLQQLERLPAILHDQQQRYSLFFEKIDKKFLKIAISDKAVPAYFRFPVICPQEHRDETIIKGEGAGFEFGNFNWSQGLHTYPPLRSEQPFPNTDRLTSSLINLPIHSQTSDADIRKMTDILNTEQA